MSTDDQENPQRSLGTLKLPESDVQPFLDALDYYGHERVAAYLRVTAYSLIKHHERGDKLSSPLGFELAPPKQEPPAPKKAPFITKGALLGLPVAMLPGLIACAIEIAERIDPAGWANSHPVTTIHHIVHGPYYASSK